MSPEQSPKSQLPTRPRALILDDDRELCELLSLRLQHHGYEVETETSARRGLALLGHASFDVMVLDLRLRDADGLEVLAATQHRAPELPVVMLTAHGSIELAVEAMRLGAFGFLTKPFDDHELLQSLSHAIENSALRKQVAGLRRIVGESSEHPRLIGTSEAICRLRETIVRIGPTDATVLISGESGTGKELVARSLHDLSSRLTAPFVGLNCGAIPADLLESELFGHSRGAFTGATRDREGLFAAAEGGTLFLDEIGEAPAPVQVKLLRVLQERRYTPVGSTAEVDANVRVIAATNIDLRAAVDAGRFRQDLFYRLHVVPINTPALRSMPEDIPLLAEVFLERAAARHLLAVPRLSPAALETMLHHPWPGNVRELANVMEAAILLAGSDELRPEHLEPLTGPRPSRSESSRPVPTGSQESSFKDALLGLSAPNGELPSLKVAREEFERAYLSEVLRQSRGNVTSAARIAGRNRTDFYELMRRVGLQVADFKG